YIEQLMRLLKNDGIVESVRGVSGGYMLARTADKITLGEILRSLEDGLELVDCISGGECQGHCPTRKIWITIYDAINETLDKITLKQMLEDNEGNNEKDIFGLCCNNIRQE
ncbi:MAG: Rrf2 family transcriptional regulator, partial [Clostridia bacterium]